MRPLRSFRSFRSFRLLIVAVAAVALLAASCGGDDDPVLGGDDGGGADGRGATSVTVVGKDITFDKTQLTATAGETVAFTFDNQDDGIQHNFHVSGQGLDEKTEITEGPVTQELEVTFAEAGEYEYICDVHPNEMQGTITVE